MRRKWTTLVCFADEELSIICGSKRGMRNARLLDQGNSTLRSVMNIGFDRPS